ncbi:ABC-type amino acid transport substrate-binding protein [Alteromonadaceae bacterium 2753L.S.0a.02]|nr:ABC-type amino acid transport substrate-binding protein [Alteromonadaceae bacterium 2753L.S.0a.02]
MNSRLLVWVFTALLLLGVASQLLLTQLSSGNLGAGSQEQPTPVPTPQPTYITKVRVAAPTSATDHRNDYTFELLNEVLKVTEPQYGPFRIEFAPAMSRERQLAAIKTGEVINVADVSATPHWDAVAKPVEFPIRRGLQNYRLLLVHCDNLAKFAEIQNLEELRTLRGGVNKQWSIAEVLAEHQFNLVYGEDYDGLFAMLAQKRFDYFPRAMNEIFREYQDRTQELPQLCIEPTLALYTVSHTHFYVAPNQPELHRRIAEGLHRLNASGGLETLLAKHHDLRRIRTELRNRRLFRIENNYIPSYRKLVNQ